MRAAVRVFEVRLSGPGGAVTSVVRELGATEFVVALAPSDPLQRTVAIIPTVPRKQLTSYMVVITDDLKDANGNDATTASVARRRAPAAISSVAVRSSSQRARIPVIPNNRPGMPAIS